MTEEILTSEKAADIKYLLDRTRITQLHFIKLMRDGVQAALDSVQSKRTDFNELSIAKLNAGPGVAEIMVSMLVVTGVGVIAAASAKILTLSLAKHLGRSRNVLRFCRRVGNIVDDSLKTRDATILGGDVLKVAITEASKTVAKDLPSNIKKLWALQTPQLETKDLSKKAGRGLHISQQIIRAAQYEFRTQEKNIEFVYSRLKYFIDKRVGASSNWIEYENDLIDFYQENNNQNDKVIRDSIALEYELRIWVAMYKPKGILIKDMGDYYIHFPALDIDTQLKLTDYLISRVSMLYLEDFDAITSSEFNELHQKSRLTDKAKNTFFNNFKRNRQVSDLFRILDILNKSEKHEVEVKTKKIDKIKEKVDKINGAFNWKEERENLKSAIDNVDSIIFDLRSRIGTNSGVGTTPSFPMYYEDVKELDSYENRLENFRSTLNEINILADKLLKSNFDHKIFRKLKGLITKTFQLVAILESEIISLQLKYEDYV